VRGVVRWLNPAAQRMVGDVRGRHFASLVSGEHVRKARDMFARKIIGGAAVTDAKVVVIGNDGTRIPLEISSVPLRDGDRIVGVFGQTSVVVEPPSPHPEFHLTPRQAEVLDLLERGRSTAQIAAELHLSTETVRNHIRHLLRALGASSRLEAVAIARRRH
jgi:DNA-binding CsgD family transcriptional regulator